MFYDLQHVMLLNGLLDPNSWIDRFGAFALWGVAIIIFIECWLFPFLPGDSLLFVIGLLISQHEQVTVPIWLACLVLSAAAVLSNIVGYLVGARIGPAIFRRPDSRFFKAEYVDHTYAFFDRYGSRAIVLARFVPIVRTFITRCRRRPDADAALRRLLGHRWVLWATGVTLLGFWLGQVALLRDHIDLVLVAVVAISLVPILIEFLRARSQQRDTRYDEESERDAVLRRQAEEQG